MAQRIAALSLIYIGTTLAWMFLAGNLADRTGNARANLEGKVASSWGSSQQQPAPRAWVKSETASERIPLESSKIDVGFDLEHRQKGLLWYSTYQVAFSGAYVFRNTSDTQHHVEFTFDLPAENAVYDDLQFNVDGRPVTIANSKTGVSGAAEVDPGKSATLVVAYHSRGLDNWRYHFGGDPTQVRDFTLNMRTNFADIDFPDNTLSPTQKRKTAEGWELQWNYKNLISSFQIGMTMPEKAQPGPLAAEISRFAPVSLLFFFFLLTTITTIQKIELHPMNYFFLACAFFSFHLLLAYLADHIAIHWALAICSIMSILLVVSYLRLVVGIRFAALEAGGAQFVYLVLFSYAFFFKGFTGLAITIGAILSLFVAMQLTGRTKWGEAA